MVMGSFGKRLMVRIGPFKATGDITAFTRLPSDKLIILASHNREDIDILCDEVYEMEDGVLRKSSEGRVSCANQ